MTNSSSSFLSLLALVGDQRGVVWVGKQRVPIRQVGFTNSLRAALPMAASFLAKGTMQVRSTRG